MMTSEQIADELYGLHCDIGRLEREKTALQEKLDAERQKVRQLTKTCAELSTRLREVEN